MRTIYTISMAVILVGVASGCGSRDNAQDADVGQAERQQALRDSAFGPMAESIDRAREVEQLQLDRKDRIDAATGDSRTQ